MSSFGGAAIFASGPHRFAEGSSGVQLIQNTALFPGVPGRSALGPLERTVTVTGRLVASSEAGLWSLRDAIATRLTFPPTRGTLVDQHGRSWTDMDFVTFTPGPTVERGRVWSVEYSARFVRLTGP